MGGMAGTMAAVAATEVVIRLAIRPTTAKAVTNAAEDAFVSPYTSSKTWEVYQDPLPDIPGDGPPGCIYFEPMDD